MFALHCQHLIEACIIIINVTPRQGDKRVSHNRIRTPFFLRDEASIFFKKLRHAAFKERWFYCAKKKAVKNFTPVT